jgi:hypothetical protein
MWFASVETLLGVPFILPRCQFLIHLSLPNPAH